MKSKLLPLATKLLITFLSGMAGLGASAQNFSWAQKWGNNDFDQTCDMEVDAEGNSYVTGIFSGTVDFDPGPATLNLTSTEPRAVFVGKYSPLGRPIWVKAFQGKYANAYRQANGIAIDKDKNVYTTGVFRDSMDFDPGPGVAILSSFNKFWSHSFVCKLDSDGNFVWVKGLGKDTAYSEVQATAIAIDGTGNVYTTGHFEGTVDFDPGAGMYGMISTASDGFVCKLDLDGNFVWSKQIGEHRIGKYAEVWSNSLALDGDGAVYTTGEFYEGADFDPGPDSLYLSAGGIDEQSIFVSKLDNNGDLVWAKSFGSGSSWDKGVAIAIDGQKNVYTVGDFGSGVDFDPGPGVDSVASFLPQEIRTYISKLDASGNFLWARSLNDPHTTFSSQVKQLALDYDGDAYVSGAFLGTVDFNTAPASSVLTSVGMLDGFVGKWDASGNLVWVKAFGGASGDMPQAVGVDSQKNVYIAGNFAGTADFNPDAAQWNLTSAGVDDAFLLKLSRCTPIQDEDTLALCKASYQWPLDGQVYTASGTYWAAGESAAGCDSVVLLHLALNPILSESITQQVCETSYTWAQTGVTYTTPGTYRDTVLASGCDSIVTLHLEINPLVQTHYAEACGSFTWSLNGETYTVSGTYADTLALAGCDSVHKLVLVIGNPAFSNGIQVFGDELVCTQPDGDLYEWVDCNNGNTILQTGTDPYFYPWNPGSYAVTVYMDGCMNTSACYGFLVDLGVTESESDVFKIFPNPVLDKFQIQATGAAEIQRVAVADLNGREIYAASVTGTAVTVPAPDWKPGVYFVRVISQNSQHVYKICKL